MRAVPLFLALCLLLTTLAPVRAHEGDSAAVLFDFGDGRYAWAHVDLNGIADGWNLTVAANESLGYAPLDFTVFSIGIRLDGVDGEQGGWPDWWWHLYVWNETLVAWESASAGASDLPVAAGDAIAWHRAVDDAAFSSDPPVATPVLPSPWTSFRGGASNAGVAGSSGPASPRPAWSYDSGSREAEGTPAVFGALVIAATDSGLVALDRGTGTRRWFRPDLQGMSSPTVAGEGVLVGAWDGRLHHVRTTDGAELWNVSLVSPGRNAISSSPLLYKGVAYVGTWNQTDAGGELVAVNLSANPNAVLWRVPTGDIHYSSPAIAGDLVVVGVNGMADASGATWDPPYGLLAVHRDGAVAWFFATDGPVASSPAVSAGRIFFTTHGSRLYAVGTDGAEAWNRTIGFSTSSPAVSAGRVFVGNGSLGGSGRVQAFTTEGTSVWTTPLNGPVQSAMVVAGEAVYATTNAPEGRVYALGASDGKVRWSWAPSPPDYILGSPAIAGGRLYVAVDSGYIYALETPEPPIPLGPGVLLAVAVLLIVIVAVFAYVRRRPRD